jgi:hypothetical protein
VNNPADMRDEFEPFPKGGSWWYYLTDDSLAGPFKTERAATISAQRESLTMYPGV